MLRRSVRRACESVSFNEQYASTKSAIKGADVKPKELTLLKILVDRDAPGSMMNILKPFNDANVSIDHIMTRESPLEQSSTAPFVTAFLEVSRHKTDPALVSALDQLRATQEYVVTMGSWKVPWYPTHIKQLDMLDQTTLAAGGDLADDPENPHPGFHDQEYRKRRTIIADNAKGYRHGDKIPDVEYTAQEKEAWGIIWDKLTALYPSHACHQYNYSFPKLIENAGYRRREIPQLQNISDYLTDTTGFSIRPVTGLLTSRDFLNALAFRVFYSTQYIRHHTQPLYTPEPDVVHEVMGHVPLFADPEFANFSQAIGIASLGADDDTITRLGRCYWYSVEFGLTKQAGSVRAYGAGLLSSYGELQYCVSKEPRVLPWEPAVAADLDFPITKYQPTYFCAESFTDACTKLQEWTKEFDFPYKFEYNPHSRKVRTIPKSTSEYMGYGMK